MDRINALINEYVDLYRTQSRKELLLSLYSRIGLLWMDDNIEPWERTLEWPEFDTLSAFTFLRPKLTDEEKKILKDWEALYTNWRNEGKLYKRYRESLGARFTWANERADAEKELGRKLPLSHWWFYPPEDEENYRTPGLIL